MQISPEKLKVIENAVAQLEKDYGKGTIMKMGDAPIQKIDAIPTGCLSLDIALGIGGLPRGRVVEIYGPESSGKTTLCLHVIAEAQKLGEAVAFIDAEHALDLNYAKNLGVDVENLFLAQPDYGEQALEIADKLVNSAGFGAIVIDSVAALVPRSEIEGEMGDATMAVQARLMSQALRKLTGAVAKSKTCLIFINQLRSKIGVMFGNPETTTGGNALKFYASARLDIRRIASIKQGDSAVGNRTKVKIVKLKIAPPFKEVEFDIMYGKGIDAIGDILDTAIALDLVKQGGAWYTIGSERIQGKEKVKEVLGKDPVMLGDLKNKINDIIKNPKVG